MFSDKRNACYLFMLCVSQFKTWNGTEWNHRDNLLHFIPWILESSFTGNNLFPQRGDKFYPASAPSHALRTQCSEWNVDYRIHPSLFHSRFKLCRTIFEN